jgi:RimJ/RimL family protein N-acetyltransferase
MIVGEKVALGPLNRQHLPLYMRWFNDLDVMRTYSVRWSPRTQEETEQWFQRVTRDEQAVGFSVYARERMIPLGYTMLHNINHYHETADFDIILGEKSHWGQGFGTEATQLTLDYGFTALNLHNIMLTVRSFNERAVRAYQRAGFRIFGRRREARQFAGQWHDVIYMECLASEFQGRVLQQLIPQPEA